jgi:hypothetical protein
VRCQEGNSLDPRKDNFLKLMMQSSCHGLFVTYDLLREEVIKKAISLNIPRSCFKASKAWAIKLIRRMGLALRHRTMICQKLPKYFEQKLLNFQWFIIFSKSSSRPWI